MEISIVDKGTTAQKTKKRGYPSKYKEIYDKLKNLPEDKEMPIKCDSEKEARLLYMAVRQKEGYTTKKRGNIIIITHS